VRSHAERGSEKNHLCSFPRSAWECQGALRQCAPTQSVGARKITLLIPTLRVAHSHALRRSFPRSASLIPTLCVGMPGALRGALPRRAWERESGESPCSFPRSALLIPTLCVAHSHTLRCSFPRSAWELLIPTLCVGMPGGAPPVRSHPERGSEKGSEKRAWECSFPRSALLIPTLCVGMPGGAPRCAPTQSVGARKRARNAGRPCSFPHSALLIPTLCVGMPGGAPRCAPTQSVGARKMPGGLAHSHALRSFPRSAWECQEALRQCAPTQSGKARKSEFFHQKLHECGLPSCRRS